MKRFIQFTFIISLFGLLLFACNMADEPTLQDVQPAEPIALTPKQSEKATADNRFAFKMFREVSVLSDEPNTFFSPLSLNMALGMLYNGTSGETRTEMADVLGLAGFTDTEINEYYQKMSQALLGIDPLTTLSIANSIWYRSGFSVKKPFIDLNKKYFDAEVQALDFSRPDAADIINKWCSDKTKDRIKEIIQKPTDASIVMFLINALYFKSKWQYEFDKKQTKQDDFTTGDNRIIKVNMMEQTSDLRFFSDQHLQCVEIPYGNQAFKMTVILPSGDTDINRLINYLDDNAWQNAVKGLSPRSVKLKLPRYKNECEMKLNDPVMNVGMKRIFGGGLLNIADAGLFVSNIKQKTFVEVNEAGTEAAAVTVIEIRESYDPNASQPVLFFANRPFLYLITEKSTGAILFIGRMDEPKE